MRCLRMLGFQKAISPLEKMQRRPLHEPNREMKLLEPFKGRLSLMAVVRLEKSLIW